jgi:HSP20 family protein
MNNSMISWDPFRELDDMTERMNRLFSRSFAPLGQAGSVLATDIYEEDGRLVVETALPHFKESEVDVQLNQNRLEIKAEHTADEESKDRNYLRRESSVSSYYRQFALPEDVDVDSASADFKNGVLRVVFDRKELPQPKRLQLGRGKTGDK